MKSGDQPWRVVGQGLAGTSLAWRFLERGAEFTIASDGRPGSSRVAAGLVNPVTGRNFGPSWRIGDFLPEAAGFYEKTGSFLGIRCWHPLPVLRLARDAEEWRRIDARMANPEAAPWIAGVAPPPPGWHAAVELRGGGRLDARAFLDASAAHFEKLGILRQREEDPPDGPDARTILCQGAAGLLDGRLGPHRCAKGEILTVHAPGWSESHIRVGAGGWLVPVGGGRFKAGSTYEWDTLDSEPTVAGLDRLRETARRLGGDDAFAVVAHEAGVRPILRRSQPVIGRHPDGGFVFNGLGSKGSLYAPGCARRLADACLEGAAIGADLDFESFRHGRA